RDDLVTGVQTCALPICLGHLARVRGRLDEPAGACGTGARLVMRCMRCWTELWLSSWYRVEPYSVGTPAPGRSGRGPFGRTPHDQIGRASRRERVLKSAL